MRMLTLMRYFVLLDVLSAASATIGSKFLTSMFAWADND